jgi:hypothetical protein
MACRVWSHEVVPVKVAESKLNRDSIVRLAIFLNSHRKRQLSLAVGDGEQYDDPVPVEPDDLESRLKHARTVLDWRIEDDISFSKIVSRRRAEFSADYESVVESALETARSLKSFCSLWDDEPPLPLAAAARCAKDALFQLSLLQNSSRREVLK